MPTAASAPASAFPPAPTPDPAALAARIRAGDRRSLARGITLIESSRRDHRAVAEALLAELLPSTGNSVRIGISGVPGVGKSTFIEAFGLHVIEQGHKVAVLAIDPSSQRSGGSILGDKTRMEMLSRNTAAFIRPSPSGGALGGVARRTRETMLACEAAGFDVVIVETVGVGQSETAVADMVDLFMLLLLPGGGDELQGIKRGIMELADLIVVNKADGAMIAAANHAAAEYLHALMLLRPPAEGWKVPVLQCSAIENRGIDAIWQTVQAYRDAMTGNGGLALRRGGQARAWMWSEIKDSLLDAFRTHPDVKDMLMALESRVGRGDMIPTVAAQTLLDCFLANPD